MHVFQPNCSSMQPIAALFSSFWHAYGQIWVITFYPSIDWGLMQEQTKTEGSQTPLLAVWVTTTTPRRMILKRRNKGKKRGSTPLYFRITTATGTGLCELFLPVYFYCKRTDTFLFGLCTYYIHLDNLSSNLSSNTETDEYKTFEKPCFMRTLRSCIFFLFFLSMLLPLF